jgi:hypothetical protein
VYCARPELLPLANAVVLVAASVIDGHERLFESVHDGIVALFACELLARLRTHCWRFLRRPLSAFDAAVILVSAMPALGVDASLLRLARAARLVHFARHIRHLRLPRFEPPVNLVRGGLA